MSNKPDIDPQETQEWLDSLEAVLENEGVERKISPARTQLTAVKEAGQAPRSPWRCRTTAGAWPRRTPATASVSWGCGSGWTASAAFSNWTRRQAGA